MRTINRSTRRAKARLVLAGASALSLALVGFGTATATASPAARTAFPGSVPAFVSTATDAGATADTTEEGEIYLSLPDENGAQQYAAAVSTPGSKLYGRYLSSHDWIKKFAPSKEDLATVKQFLTSSGFTVTGVPRSREYIVFRGPADLFGDALGTELHNYKVDGKTVSAPSSAPSLPKAVASHVLGLNLGDAEAKLTRTFHQRPGQGVPGAQAQQSKKLLGSGISSSGAVKKSTKYSRTNANQSTSTEQCSSYYGQNHATRPAAYGRTSFPTTICGYLPSQLRSAGDLNRLINSGIDGGGVRIGIVDAYDSPTLLKDTNTYMLQAGEPLLTKFDDISYPASSFSDQAACDEPSTWQTEQTLDVQSAHSVAPGAKIVYSGGYNCGGGLDLALSKILDHHLADLVSNSYGYAGEGIPDDVVQGKVNIELQAAGEGIGLYFGTGDDGDEQVDFGTPAANFPATSPFVTAVGGTTEYIDASGKVVADAGWGDILDQVVNGAYTAPLPGNLYGGGGGGGISTLFGQPWYQQGVVPTSLSGTGTSAARVEPDVADLADAYTGFQIAVSPITDNTTLATGPLEYQTWGGTSLASPIVAAKMALVQQASHHKIGFANPLLYQQAQQGTASFHDVTSPAATLAMAYTGITSGKTYLVTQNQGLSLSLAKGYDDFTGLGTLNVPVLANNIARSTSHHHHRKGHNKVADSFRQYGYGFYNHHGKQR